MLLCTIINHCQDLCIRNMFTIITSCVLKNMHQSRQWSMIFNITIQIHDKISSISGEGSFCRTCFWINHLLQGSHFTIKVWRYRNLSSQGKKWIIVILTRHSLKRENNKDHGYNKTSYTNLTLYIKYSSCRQYHVNQIQPLEIGCQYHIYVF